MTVPAIPNHFATIQSDVSSQLNSIISSYINNPDALLSLQDTLYSILNNQTQSNPSVGTFQPMHNQTSPPQTQSNGSQATLGLVENILRSLVQCQQGSLPNQEASLQLLSQQGAENNQFKPSQEVTYAAGITPDNLAASQEESDHLQLGSKPESTNRKRRRSSSPH